MCEILKIIAGYPEKDFTDLCRTEAVMHRNLLMNKGSSKEIKQLLNRILTDIEMGSLNRNKKPPNGGWISCALLRNSFQERAVCAAFSVIITLRYWIISDLDKSIVMCRIKLTAKDMVMPEQGIFSNSKNLILFYCDSLANDQILF